MQLEKIEYLIHDIRFNRFVAYQKDKYRALGIYFHKLIELAYLFESKQRFFKESELDEALWQLNQVGLLKKNKQYGYYLFGFSRSMVPAGLNKTKGKAKYGIVDRLRGFEGCERLSNVSCELQDRWLKTYGIDWVKRELEKANRWCMSNPKRSPKKNFDRFFQKWLSRSEQFKKRYEKISL